MKRIDVLKSIYGVKEFSNMVFGLVKDMKSSEELAELLDQEMPEEQLQIIKSAAERENYPISFTGLQQ